MASAVRVTSARWAGTAVACRGGFGQAVADLLTLAGAHAVTLDAPVPQAGADRLIVALWRPAPDLYEQVDAAAWTAGLPWLPVVAEHPHLVVGPWTVPGAGPCHRCYRMRRVQHDTQAPAAAALAAAYRADDAAGPGGHLPHHARQAVGLAALACDGPAGRVYTVNVLTGEVTTNDVVGCHGCPRCGPEPIGADGTVARTVTDLLAARRTGIPA